MAIGLLGNESPDLNRFLFVTSKPENGVRLQATPGNQNPMGLPVGQSESATSKLIVADVALSYVVMISKRERGDEYVGGLLSN